MTFDLQTRIENILERGVRENKIPGACVSISRGQKELVYMAYDMADKERKIPMQTDSLFRIFSMTKPVTAVATMMLWEQGVLQLDDPISWYIPSFQKKQVDHNGTLVPANREILIQDLLNMTSGIPYPDCWSLSQKAMGAFYDEINNRWQTEHPVTTQEFASRVGSDVPLLFQPGEKWFYGASADILGAVLERAADKPLDALFREMIFEPLDMQDTDFYIPKEKQSRLAQLYIWDNQKNDLRVEPDPHLGMTDYRKKPAFFSGGAGLVSTLRDYTNFSNMLAGKGQLRKSGVRLISEHTWRYLTSPQLTSTQKKSIDWPQLSGYSYGNLLRVLEEPQVFFTNAPKGEFGWDGWTGPYFCVSPCDDETVMVYLIQVCDGSTSDIMRRLRTAAFGI
ncbi:MAG: beta-lactamase family protein [Ruminococcus sp.]|nr:beta-lactamase family protein [Ruminococcus sp.]